MNLLVIGGLLVVALLALSGAILLAIGERSTTTKAPPSPAPTKAEQAEQPGQAASEKQQMSGATQPSAIGPNLPALNQEEHLPMLNGQFYEMVSELRSLHEQASQLEQRLSILTVLADHLEQSSPEHFTIEEDKVS